MMFFPILKKNVFFILDRIKYHKLNIWPYLFFFQKKILRTILNLFPYKDVSILSNDLNPESKMDTSFKKNKRVDFNSYDFSNFIIFKNNIIKKKIMQFIRTQVDLTFREIDFLIRLKRIFVTMKIITEL